MAASCANVSARSAVSAGETLQKNVSPVQAAKHAATTNAKGDKRASLVRITRPGKELLARLVAELEPKAETELTRLMGSKAGEFLKMMREAVKKSGLEIMHDL